MEKCDNLINENVPCLLLHLVNTYRDENNKNLVITALKIMANIARYNKECAIKIADSSKFEMIFNIIFLFRLASNSR